MTAARATIGAAIGALCLALSAAACTTDVDDVPRTICPAGVSACGQQCVDFTTDPTSCGGCGIPCGAGQACADGVCRCAAGMPCYGDDGATPGSPPVLITSAPGDFWR